MREGWSTQIIPSQDLFTKPRFFTRNKAGLALGWLPNNKKWGIESGFYFAQLGNQFFLQRPLEGCNYTHSEKLLSKHDVGEIPLLFQYKLLESNPPKQDKKRGAQVKKLDMQVFAGAVWNINNWGPDHEQARLGTLKLIQEDPSGPQCYINYVLSRTYFQKHNLVVTSGLSAQYRISDNWQLSGRAAMGVGIWPGYVHWVLFNIDEEYGLFYDDPNRYERALLVSKGDHFSLTFGLRYRW